MTIYIKKMKNFKAFTLIEVMICVILTCIVVFFIYTMMLSSHRTYAKLFSISKQRNDLRYFETVLKKSVMNAEYFYCTNKTMAFGYYDTSGMFGSDGVYRVDVYEFGNNSILENNENRSKNLDGINLLSFSGTKANMYLTVYKSDKDYTVTLLNKKLRNTEIVLENVNKLYWCYHDYNDNSSDTFEHHSYLNFALIFSKELDGAVKASLKEINYESQLYRFSMKNIRFKNN